MQIHATSSFDEELSATSGLLNLILDGLERVK